MRLTKLFNEFFQAEKAAGFILIICTVFSVFMSNSSFSESYTHIWHTTLFDKPLEYWINDGLMAIFFLLIGLELEREIYIGELSNLKQALLPISGALGGMLVPALLYTSLNFGTETQSGFGIPMATDIAFAIGILSLLGSKVPPALKIFLTALAVIDDLGAILVIAFFYTDTISWGYLMASLGIFVILLIFNRTKVRNLIPYIIGGIFMWYFMLQSGVHATITGVLLAFALPFGNGNEKLTSYIMQHFLHLPVTYFILPVFALANTAIIIDSNWQNALTQHYTLGILIGLLLGKPIGIFCFSYLSAYFKLGSLPEGTTWKSIIGVSFLGGIGFTMSIFISLLAFSDASHINNSKLMILIASVLAGILGYIALSLVLKDSKTISSS